ncbi:MAG: hypothetical protein RRY29_08150 [Desulfovibrionaceae bacterium]
MGAKNTGLDHLPAPKRSQGGQGKLLAITLVAVVLVGGAIYWLTRDEATKLALKSRVETLVQDTPLEAVRQFFLPPPPPPVGLSQPKTDPGTLAGQVVVGTVPSGVDDTVDPASSAPPVAPKVEEDSVVRALFVEDMAQWMVARYQPSKDGGKASAGVQAANMRYGTTLRGITYRGEDLLNGRESLFRYAFTPSMLQALYALYVDRFVEELARAAAAPRQGSPLTGLQTDEMYRAYAARFTALAQVLEHVGAVPDLRNYMDKVNKSTQKAIDIHAQVSEAVFVLDEAREAGKDGPIEAAQLRVNGLNAQYRRAIDERTVAQQALLTAIRGTAAGRTMDEETVVFVANWIERRLVKQPEAQQSAKVAAQILYDLAKRLQQAASVAR